VKPFRRLTALALALTAVLGAPATAAAAGTVAPVDASPLAANGFESPACTSPQLEAQLAPAQRTNCTVSGVAGFSEDAAELYLRPGDVVECEIEKIGTLSNPVISWEQAYGVPAPPLQRW